MIGLIGLILMAAWSAFKHLLLASNISELRKWLQLESQYSNKLLEAMIELERRQHLSEDRLTRIEEETEVVPWWTEAEPWKS